MTKNDSFNMRNFLIFLFISSFYFNAFGQQLQVNFHINSSNNLNYDTSKLFKKTVFKDSLVFKNYLKEQIVDLFQEGFVGVSVDSIRMINKHIDAYIFLGKSFNKLKISYHPAYEDVLRKVNSKYLSAKYLSFFDFEKENKKITDYLENNGFPYSKVFLDSILFVDDTVSAFLMIERGEKIYFDTLKIDGNLKVSQSFISGYSGIKIGKEFNLRTVSRLKKQIEDLEFAQPKGVITMVKNEDKIKVILPINKISNNRFDGILGILPNDKTTGKVLLTGEINLFVQNILRSAEEINFKWQKLESQSQKLHVDFKIPYIFNSNIGLSSNLNLYKQDSTFLNSNLGVGVLYFFRANNHLGFVFNRKSSAILSKDTTIQKQFRPYEFNAYGLELSFSQLDYKFNPNKGFDCYLNANLGPKTYSDRENQSSKSIQYNAGYFIKWYLQMMPKHTILIENKASFLVNETSYLNELYRIGGLNTLRGFMESSIYASSYSILTLEYRYIFERNSAFFMFLDAAWYEKKMTDYYYDYPLGFGIGLFFKTKAGIFSISYALGKQKNEAISVKNAKIHFGFINKF